MSQELEELILPWEAVKSDKSKKEYLRKSRHLLEFGKLIDSRLIHHRKGLNPLLVSKGREEIRRGMVEFIRRSIQNPMFARNLVISFVKSENLRIERKEIGSAFLANCLKPVKLALEMNEVVLPWKKVMRLIPRSPRVGADREYNLDELRRLLSVASLHIQVPILLMSSSGMRIGAFEYLNVGHLSPVKVEGKLLCGKALVYAGEGDDEYETFISKEAWLKWEEYLRYRKNAGEKVIDDSPLVVTRDFKRRLKVSSIKNIMNDLLWKTGIRKEKKKRHEVEMDHGFRKHFNNIAKDYIQEDYVEKLMGHSTGVKAHYDRGIPKPAFEQYLRAQPHLSIDEAYRNEAELSQKLAKSEKERAKDLRKIEFELMKERDSRRTMEERLSEIEERDKRREEIYQELKRRGLLK